MINLTPWILIAGVWALILMTVLIFVNQCRGEPKKKPKKKPIQITLPQWTDLAGGRYQLTPQHREALRKAWKPYGVWRETAYYEYLDVIRSGYVSKEILEQLLNGELLCTGVDGVQLTFIHPNHRRGYVL